MNRRHTLTAGILYLVTFAAIPAQLLYGPLKAGTQASMTAAHWGALLEVVVALACIGTAVALFPVVRRVGEARALGFVGARTLEAAMIFMGVALMLTLMAHPDDRGLLTTYDAAFLLGQSLMPGINALLLGSLLYQARLVPRVIPLVGLIGAPIHLTAVVLTLFGVVSPLSPVTALAALPIAAWEFALGVYLVVKGTRSDLVRHHPGVQHVEALQGDFQPQAGCCVAERAAE